MKKHLIINSGDSEGGKFGPELSEIDIDLTAQVLRDKKFWRENKKIFVSTRDEKILEKLKSLVKNYFETDVEFLGFDDLKVSEIKFSKKDNFFEIAKNYWGRLQIPVFLIEPPENGYWHFLPLHKILEDGSWTNFGTCGGFASLEEWFFESFSNKYFWDHYTGFYNYPKFSEKYKRILKDFIKNPYEWPKEDKF